MSDPPDLATLARRYLDLWQEHLGSMARDPAVSDALARAFSLMTQGLADNLAEGGRPHQPAAPEDGPGQPATGDHASTPPASDAPRGPSGTASGAPTAGVASGHPGPSYDELAARVDGLERRLALLEAALGGLLAGAGRPGGNS